MTTSSTCQLLTALGFIMLMYIDMTTAIPPPGLLCDTGTYPGGVCGNTQEAYTYQQSYQRAYYLPCNPSDGQFRWPGQCGAVYSIGYRTATGYRSVPRCCSGYTLNRFSCCEPTCSGGCLNGGTCSYGTCICPPGYSGTRCEIVSCPGGCLNGGTCSRGTCNCRPGFSGSRCQTEALEVELTTDQEDDLKDRISSLIRDMGGSFDSSRLNEEQFYNTPLVELSLDQKKSISDSCSAAPETDAQRPGAQPPPGQPGSPSSNRVCPGYQVKTDLVLFTGSNSRQIGQLNGWSPGVFNEECYSSYCSGPGNSCRCNKVQRTTSAQVMVINVDSNRVTSVAAVRKEVILWSCAATY